MFRRPDGIVDFDPDICIGCKGCIQACPYDAIYIHPETGTAAKCHFCAHRVEVGLEPACVTACPERALIVGDIDDGASEISRLISRATVTVRKPELGTRPKVFYKGADQCTLDPLAAVRPADTMWGRGRELPVFDGAAPHAVPIPGRAAAARVAYDVPREGHPWGWKISAYLFAKSIGAGALAVGGPALILAAGLPSPLDRRLLVPPILALAFLFVTTLFLVFDLKRPERFLRLIFRPQWRSWLVRGTYCLLAAVASASAWLAIVALMPIEMPELPLDAPPGTTPPLAEVPLALKIVASFGFATAIPAAMYTAFLFAQARGRAFWQSPLLAVHLVVQAFVGGSAALAIVTALIDGGFAARPFLFTLIAALGLDWLSILSELYLGAGPEDARLAARSITRGRFKIAFRWLVVGARAGAALFAVEALVSSGFLAQACAIVAAALALVGLAAWEHLYVLAGQDPPLS
jgi:formate-dependent nitrite reductase membrane component NrfD/ferredoxin